MLDGTVLGRERLCWPGHLSDEAVSAPTRGGEMSRTLGPAVGREECLFQADGIQA